MKYKVGEVVYIKDCHRAKKGYVSCQVIDASRLNDRYEYWYCLQCSICGKHWRLEREIFNYGHIYKLNLSNNLVYHV